MQERAPRPVPDEQASGTEEPPTKQATTQSKPEEEPKTPPTPVERAQTPTAQQQQQPQQQQQRPQQQQQQMPQETNAGVGADVEKVVRQIEERLGQRIESVTRNVERLGVTCIGMRAGVDQCLAEHAKTQAMIGEVTRRVAAQSQQREAAMEGLRQALQVITARVEESATVLRREAEGLKKIERALKEDPPPPI